VATSRLEIDLSAIEHNLGVIRRVLRAGAGGRSAPVIGPTEPPHATAPSSHQTIGAVGGGAHGGAGICAVIKQDAYGMGAVRIAKRLAASGVDMLAVYTPDEGRAVAEAVPSTPIIVLMPTRAIDRMDPLYRHASTGRIHLVVHDLDQLNSLTDMASRLGVSMPIHVQVDTGLARGGACPEHARTIVERAAAHGRMRLAGLMTHFASPATDEAFTREQSRLFREFIAGVKPMLRDAVAGGRAEGGMEVHAANSAATFRSAKFHGTMVRVGQALLGYCIEDAPHATPSPTGAQMPAWDFLEQAKELQPAARWTSSIVHIQQIPAGWPVGYGSTWRAPRTTRIALVPVGYADGFARSLGGGFGVGWIGLTGRPWERLGGAERDDMGDAIPAAGRATGAQSGAVIYAPVVGRVSMDQITIDVTDVPERFAQVGMEVELFGRDRAGRNYLPTQATSADTITHELLTRVSPRVERIYRYPGAQAATPKPTIAGSVMPGTISIAPRAPRATGTSDAQVTPQHPANIARLVTPIPAAARR
jgi:alanine racemase